MSLLGDILGREPVHVYLSGPMRNRDGFNFPAFFEVMQRLHAQNPYLTIFNPAARDVERLGLFDLMTEDATGLLAGRYLQSAEAPFDIRAALAEDMQFICESCDLLILLPEWQESSGARAEVSTAQAIGIEVIEWERLSEALADRERTQYPLMAACVAPDPVSGPSEPDSEEVHAWQDADGIEVRVVADSGGEKGAKLACFDQIPPEALIRLAEHFGRGARKYSAHNFRRGYAWSLSLNAALRHLLDFWAGRDWDVCPADGKGCQIEHPETGEDTRRESEHGWTCYNHTGSHHLDAFMWHAVVLRTFYDEHKEYDDRYVTTHNG